MITSHSLESCPITSALAIPMDPRSVFIDLTERCPDAVSLSILSYLSFATLAADCLVSKKWNALANNPLLLKKIVYRDLVFGNAQWARCFNQEMLKDEDYQEEFRSLPNDIGAIYKKNFKTHMLLVRMPKTLNGGLTVRSLGVLAKKYFPANENGYRIIRDEILKEHGDKSIVQSRWVHMMRDVLPSSVFKNYAVQQAMVTVYARDFNDAMVVPNLLQVAVCVLAQYFYSSLHRKDQDSSAYTRYLSGSYTRCQEKIKGLPVIVGQFFECDGLGIRYFSPTGRELIGITAIREF